MKAVRFKLYLSTLLLLTVTPVWGQDLDPIRWAIKKNVTAVKAGTVFKVQVIATIEDGWHLYSPDQRPGGPIPTRIVVLPDQKFKLAGDIESPLPEVAFDPNFNLETQTFEQEAVFTLPIEVAKDTPAGKNSLAVTTFYQSCNDKACLPPKTVKLELDIEVTGGSNPAPSATAPGNSAGRQNSIGPQASDAKPIEFEFVDFTGKPRKISEFRGKFVLIDFWASWCQPCLADIPKLKVLYEKHKTDGFEIVGMDAETLSDDDDAPDPVFAKQQAEQARKIIATRGVVWTQATAETAVPIAKKIFGVKALPTKILLDKEGKLVARIGEHDDLVGLIEKRVDQRK